MNKVFFKEMRSVVKDDVEWIKTLMPDKHIQLIDTGKDNGNEKKTAQGIARTILSIVQNY